MNKLKLILLTCSLTLVSFVEAQQMPTLGWFEKAQLYYNPAFAGQGERLQGTLINRTQWKGVQGAPLTRNLNIESPIGKGVGVGFALSQDKLGFIRDNNASFNASYRLYLNETAFLQMGIRAGVSLVNASYSDAFQWDGGDYLGATANSTIPRLGLGALYKHTKYYIGFSAPDFFSVDSKNLYNDGNTAMRKNYFLIAGGTLELTEYLSFVPSVMVRYYQTSGINYVLNAGFELNQTVTAGASYANPNIYGFYGLVSVTPKVRFGYRHELSPNSISIGEFGTGELLLTYGFN